jgi:MFS family permease
VRKSRLAAPPPAVPGLSAGVVRARLAPTIVAILALLYWASLYTYVPTLPTYAKTLTDNLASVGVILSMYGLWQALVRLPIGMAADWLGLRKPFIVGGLALAAAGALLMGAAGSADALLVGRAVTGLAAGTWVPLTVVFVALFPPKDAIRATTIMTLMSAIARVFATGINGKLNDAGGYPLAFTVAAALAGLAIFTALLVPEQRRPSTPPSIRGLARLLKRRDVLLPAFLNGLGQYVNQAIAFGFIPILAKGLGADDNTVSLLTALHLIVYTPTILAATVLLRRFRVSILVHASFIALAAGSAAAALGGATAGGGLAWLMASQALIGVGIGLGYPLLMGIGIAHVREHERTTAMGLHQSLYAIGMFVGPWVCGILAEALGIPAMAWITAAMTLVFGIAGTAWVMARPRSV